MAILWCGGEDIDFSLGAAITPITTASHFRAGYPRCTVRQDTSGSISKSSIFAGGAITSAWLSARMITFNVGLNLRMIGLGLSGTNKCLLIGTDSANAAKLALSKYDGTTLTQLAAELGTSLAPGVLQRLEVQVVNYGATATVNVYLDGALIITFTGNVTVSGMTNFDSVFVMRSNPSGSMFAEFSEIMVASEDLRAFPGLVTLALTGDGTTTDWTGIFSTINGTTISDATPNYTDASDQLQEFDVTNLPSGTFKVRAIKIAARAAKAAGTPTQIALGYNEAGTVTVGGDIALTTAYATYEQLDLVNPRTSADWDQSILNALQIAAKSKA